MRKLSAWAVSGLLLVACASESSAPASDGKSNWLRCEASDDCGRGEQCIDGVCQSGAIFVDEPRSSEGYTAIATSSAPPEMVGALASRRPANEPATGERPATAVTTVTDVPSATVTESEMEDSEVPESPTSADAPCGLEADFTWRAPSVLDASDEVSGISLAIDRKGRALATWLASDWNPATGVYDHNLRFSRHGVGGAWTSARVLASAAGGAWLAGAKTVLNADGVGFAVWMDSQGPRILALRHEGTTWAAVPHLVSTGQINDTHPYLGLGVDGAGNAWLVWRANATQVFGSRYDASAGAWAAPTALASGASGPASPIRPAQTVLVNATGDAVLFWRTPTEYWARYYRDGAWSDPDSFPNQGEVYDFAFDDSGVGLGWFTEPSGDPLGPTLGRMRRFEAATGWDDGFTLVEHGEHAYGQKLALHDVGDAWGHSLDADGAWSTFELPFGTTAVTGAQVVFAADEPMLTPGYEPNQWSSLVASGTGQTLATWGVGWPSSNDETEFWSRRRCDSVGWGQLERIAGGSGASGPFATAIDDAGRAVILLSGKSHELWAVNLE